MPLPVSPEVLVVLGTRPEAIKLSPLIQQLQEHPRLRPVVVSTGQHQELVDYALAATGCEIAANLHVARPNLTLNELSSSVVSGLDAFVNGRYGPPPKAIRGQVRDHYPAMCIVHGDTSSAAAAALTAFHLRIPVLHVEAGLRTGTTLSPFPEELNRQLIGRIASFHLAPTRANVQNLVREGVDIGRTYVTGNTGIDALQNAAAREEPYGRPELAWLEDDTTTRVVTVTAHRRENWAEGIAGVASAVHRLANAYPDVRFVVPVHPNPVVAQVMRDELSAVPTVTLTEPMEYRPFARLLARSYLVITDSGGIQEEAPAFGVPVLVARTTTERGEGVEAGTLELVGIDPERIVASASRILDDQEARDAFSRQPNPYGDGHASERIVDAIEHLVFNSPVPRSEGPGFIRADVLEWAGFRRTDAIDGPTYVREGVRTDHAVHDIEGMPIVPNTAETADAPHGAAEAR
ncbi:non-hydrolyzing UDP-N-acetylglucosamine 2-epimerase [Cellulomonas sp. PhB143]|uniref:non-hydrolyzing UDP-N-acetylglucosamine 2-epimerase n=1 Tax=Cellulomonas sp. PhB143 TaxID=2485186 RepID=UPI000FBAEF29|nr:UDP-N-acetylglucosamine 2-epimerase (non-hydrolyzing) [Cellulomonas sp. PhB143]ROS79110.1 UDP-N-acetylglucosamine 2-epimerase (non-hydrolysing) [Cellulomonas sp. PhB143]